MRFIRQDSYRSIAEAWKKHFESRDQQKSYVITKEFKGVNKLGFDIIRYVTYET